MKCSKCGANMQEGTLYCPVCGQEVQWVPDYSTLETLMQQHQIKKSIPDPEEIKRKQEQEEARRKAEEKKRKVHTTVLGFVICVLLLALIAFIINRKNYNSFDYQLAQAESELSNKNFDKALTYADRALSLNSDSVEANLLLAEIFTAQGDTGTALPILESAVKNHPTSVNAYGQLLRLYEALDKKEEIKALMDNCTEEKILEKYAAYICEVPKFSDESGTYKKKLKLNLYPSGDSDTIYYTTDGSIPDKTSRPYSGSIELPEGSTVLNVIAYNEKGIPSEIVTQNYTITLVGPETPEITPASGEFEITDTIKVTVPKGCTAYYAFNETPTTSSKRYRGPVSMQEGENIFSVILVDEDGKASNVASETYVVY
ncbi:hypothetical protein C3B58_14295 [Lactonifactor longoviformis]|uniref:Tetratricopeptide repeat-containing protein n=1 Tax=Lactonifactor longoviformis DSM 17459 TaxID=1122155 RepID=A0A1M4ZHY0_9CLOT|nr:chitobiase/beta-hexosaminidase C-terminal domain-containing protein [Lactonifactor longoviformis]POP31923.1 hypothetical protein C3B58_14295 [Lactonifactor longoviformis]SHF17660.1 Tetratricopeptide repeat-containing protein [Lactonifactor longoviformis DSM 17459]